MITAVEKFAGVELTDEERKEVRDLVVFEKPETVANPFSGELVELCPEAVAVYDWIKGAEMLCDYRSVETGLGIFMRNWPEAYMVLLD